MSFFRRNRGEEADEVTREQEEIGPFYTEETKTLDTTRIQNRDIPFRKRAGIPECAETTTEARLTLCRERLNKVLDEYKGKQMKPESNLTKQQKQGLKKLKRRVKNREIMFPNG